MDLFQSQKRAAFLTQHEKSNLVLELVHKYKDVIENKRTDGLSSQQKNNGWKLICREFNASDRVTKRNVEQLKKCWSNTKQRCRKEKAQRWRYASGTGGGGPSSPPDPLLEKVDALLPHVNLRLPSCNDSDGFGSENISTGQSRKFTSL